MKFFAEKLKAQFLRSKTKKYGVYGINSKLNFCEAKNEQVIEKRTTIEAKPARIKQAQSYSLLGNNTTYQLRKVKETDKQKPSRKHIKFSRKASRLKAIADCN
jgi:hypothetical protein